MSIKANATCCGINELTDIVNLGEDTLRSQIIRALGERPVLVYYSTNNTVRDKLLSFGFTADQPFYNPGTGRYVTALTLKKANYKPYVAPKPVVTARKSGKAV